MTNDTQAQYEPLSEAELVVMGEYARLIGSDGDEAGAYYMRGALATIRALQGEVAQWREVAGWLAYQEPGFGRSIDEYSDAQSYIVQAINAGTIRTVRKLMDTKKG